MSEKDNFKGKTTEELERAKEVLMIIYNSIAKEVVRINEELKKQKGDL